MKQFAFLLLAAVGLVGCQPAPIIINNEDERCHEHHGRPPVIIERDRPPVIIERRPPVIIEQRPPIIIQGGCNAHHHCGRCPVCRSHGWVSGIGIHIEKGRVGVDIDHHHHH